MKNESRKHEQNITKFEAKIEILEQEKAGITEKIEKGEPDLDFYAVNKRLIHIEEDITSFTEKWEQEAMLLENIIVKYEE